MLTFEYTCPECEQLYTCHVKADRLDSCRSEGCDGIPRRAWKSVNFGRVPGGGRGKS